MEALFFFFYILNKKFVDRSNFSFFQSQTKTRFSQPLPVAILSCKTEQVIDKCTAQTHRSDSHARVRCAVMSLRRTVLNDGDTTRIILEIPLN